MESFSEKTLYKKVSDSIRLTSSAINDQLGSSKIDSKTGGKETEQKIIDFVSLDCYEMVVNHPKADYYDLDEVGKIFSMLEPPRQEGKKRLRSTKSGSLLSLTSSSSPCIEDIPNQDNISEICSHLKEIRDMIGGISNCRIESPDFDTIKNDQTTKNTFFVDLVRKTWILCKMIICQ